MDFDQILSILMQIGVFAIVLCFLYGFHRLMDGFEEDGRAQIQWQRNARRRAAQERILALEQLSVEQLPLLSPALKSIEHALLKPSGGGEMRASPAEFSRQQFIGKTDEAKFYPVDDIDFICVQVGISLEEEILQ
jgi:hypothetical protein